MINSTFHQLFSTSDFHVPMHVHLYHTLNTWICCFGSGNSVSRFIAHKWMSQWQGSFGKDSRSRNCKAIFLYYKTSTFHSVCTSLSRWAVLTWNVDLQTVITESERVVGRLCLSVYNQLGCPSHQWTSISRLFSYALHFNMILYILDDSFIWINQRISIGRTLKRLVSV